ncbi:MULTISPECIES: hypothetical protein [Spirosoma]|uniref:Uncharacterized protein n=1 Tax=Spirosoma sordidisoli TaxID=2502893 RepID=A0A4Q2UPS3_9BACT|nr:MULTISPECIES: hypothetical protein [Spirosoma]RYC69791.1 hypothetical protein EQG79_14445 [Spirosoma sordidisoli]
MAKLSKVGLAPPPPRPYSIIGLTPAATMPIDFEGQRYDLANLTESELSYLLQFPQQVPYLQTDNVGDVPV